MMDLMKLQLASVPWKKARKSRKKSMRTNLPPDPTTRAERRKAKGGTPKRSGPNSLGGTVWRKSYHGRR